MFEVLDEVCKPTRATRYSAGVDLYARDSIVIGAGETKIVPLGVKLNGELPSCWVWAYGEELRAKDDFKISYYLELHPRSSLRAKGLIVGVGIIDLDFPDEIGLIVHNPILEVFGASQGDKCPTRAQYRINKGDKVAQILLKEHKGYLLGIESDVERSGGFGSSGK